MKLQFLSPALHGVLDYLAAGALIVLPVVLGLSGVALWLSIAGGVGLIAYSLLTNYRFGVVRLISFNLHLLLDVAAAVGFIVAAIALKFDAFTSTYYFVMAGGVIAVVLASERAAHGRTVSSAA
jgi:hypothetical protein